jgi:glucose/mannose-6-phosphate isomerase
VGVVPLPIDELPQPRTSIGASSVPILCLLERAGLLEGASAMVSAAVDQLRVRRDQLAGGAGPSAEAAERIGRTIPLIHGADGPAAVAAQRCKTQVNENAKAPAFWSAHPELCHNELAGWGQHGDVTRQLITLVTMRTPDEDAQIAKRFDLVTQILREVVADVVTLDAEGTGDLAQLFDLVLQGDVLSLHLAGNEGIDPGPVPVLGELKDALRR